MRDSLPETFRKEIITRLLTILRQGESCSLIGVGSSGKSNIVRHIDRADVREYFLGDHAQRVLNLYVNCTKLTETTYTAYGLYCLILEVLMKSVRDAQSDVAQQYPIIRTLWKEALVSKSDAMARSNLEDALDAVFGAGVEQVFISLDDFDPYYTKTPPTALNSLRALRDDYKTKVMYVIVTRRELGYLRDPAEVEDFLELVAPATTIPAGPYSVDDAKSMIQRLAARETPPRTFSKLEQERLLELSGRHPGLLRILYKVTRDQIPLMSGDLLDGLRQHPAIVEECEKIWASLEVSERNDLEALVSECQPSASGIDGLLGKGIITTTHGTHCASSPVFANFVEDHLKQQLLIQPLPGQEVRVNNQVVSGLSGMEYHLLLSLVHQYPRPAARNQLLEKMFMAEAGVPQTGGPPERRLDTYLGELKRKIDIDNQEVVVQEPDGGCRLLSCTK